MSNLPRCTSILVHPYGCTRLNILVDPPCSMLLLYKGSFILNPGVVVGGTLVSLQSPRIQRVRCLVWFALASLPSTICVKKTTSLASEMSEKLPPKKIPALIKNHQLLRPSKLIARSWSWWSGFGGCEASCHHLLPCCLI